MANIDIFSEAAIAVVIPMFPPESQTTLAPALLIDVVEPGAPVAPVAPASPVGPVLPCTVVIVDQYKVPILSPTERNWF